MSLIVLTDKYKPALYCGERKIGKKTYYVLRWTNLGWREHYPEKLYPKEKCKLVRKNKAFKRWIKFLTKKRRKK